MWGAGMIIRRGRTETTTPFADLPPHAIEAVDGEMNWAKAWRKIEDPRALTHWGQGCRFRAIDDPLFAASLVGLRGALWRAARGRRSTRAGRLAMEACLVVGRDARVPGATQHREAADLWRRVSDSMKDDLPEWAWHLLDATRELLSYAMTGGECHTLTAAARSLELSARFVPPWTSSRRHAEHAIAQAFKSSVGHDLAWSMATGAAGQSSALGRNGRKAAS